MYLQLFFFLLYSNLPPRINILQSPSYLWFLEGRHSCRGTKHKGETDRKWCVQASTVSPIYWTFSSLATQFESFRLTMSFDDSVLMAQRSWVQVSSWVCVICQLAPTFSHDTKTCRLGQALAPMQCAPERVYGCLSQDVNPVTNRWPGYQPHRTATVSRDGSQPPSPCQGEAVTDDSWLDSVMLLWRWFRNTMKLVTVVGADWEWWYETVSLACFVTLLHSSQLHQSPFLLYFVALSLLRSH